MPNPFFYGGKVSPNLFVGRSQQLRRIFSCLEIANTGQLQSVSIVGPHRIGRSSLLNYITAKYHQHLQSPHLYRFVYVSPHDANCHTAGEFLCKVLDALALPLHTHHNATLQEFQEAILLLNQNGIHPIICLDEFEDLLNTNSFSDGFFDVLRHLMSESALAFVIASTHPLSDLVLTEKYTSPFFNIFTIVQIGEFIVAEHLDEADLIVDRGRQCDYPFSDAETRLMRKLAGRHPYKLQLAGSLIYQSKMNGTVNSNSVKRDFKAQLKQAGLAKNLSRTLLKQGKLFVISVGKALLEVRRSKDEISESSAFWWGIGILAFLLLLIVGVIPMSLLLKFGSHWLGK
jgi:hypothetical protein